MQCASRRLYDELPVVSDPEAALEPDSPHVHEGGNLLAHDVEILSDAGAYPLLSGFVLLYITINAVGPYRCENVRVHARAAYTSNTPGSAFRGVGGMQPVIGYEGQIDEVASATGRGRVEVRKTNAFTRGDRIPAGQAIETAVWLPQCIEAVLDAIGSRPQPSSPEHRVGLGLACNVQPYGRVAWMNDSASAWVGCERDGRIVVSDAAVLTLAAARCRRSPKSLSAALEN